MARTNAEMTRAQVAEHLGVSPHEIANIENSKEAAAADVTFVLADLLGVDARWLATGIDVSTFERNFDERTLSIARAVAGAADGRREAIVTLLRLKI